MFRAMVYKELRETTGIVLIGLAFYFYFTVKAMRHDLLFSTSIDYLFEIPLIGGSYLSSFVWVSAGLTIALGFRQSLGEALRGTWKFLLHRPVGRTQLILVKLLVGVAVYLVCAAAAVLAYAWWAATPGTHASPFEWSMTEQLWKVWMAMPLVYLGAFLSGIRPGRWVGTRLLPVAAASAMAALVPFLRWWPVCGLGLIALSSVVLVSSIFFVVRTRDF
jgi:hypothetical protein